MGNKQNKGSKQSKSTEQTESNSPPQQIKSNASIKVSPPKRAINVSKHGQYHWNINQFDEMKELGLSPLGYSKELTITKYKQDPYGNILDIDMNNEWIRPDAPWIKSGPTGHSFLIYNAGFKANDKSEYSFNIECAPNDPISFTCTTYHRQEVGWIVQYMLGLSDDNNTRIEIQNKSAYPLYQTGYNQSATNKHFTGSFNAPIESGNYYLLWVIGLQYSMKDAIQKESGSIGKKIKESQHYRKIARLSVGISYEQFYQNAALIILKQYPEFESLLFTLFMYLSVRSPK